MAFSCTANHTAERVVLTVAGDVDLAAHTQFHAEIEHAWDGTADLVIDCSQILFLDSMGLRVLVHAMQRADDNGRSLALAAPSPPVLRVLELAGVKELFTIVGPMKEAAPDQPA